MRDLSRRTHEDEWMDGDDVSQSEFAACMADLATVNTLTLARRPTLAFVAAALRATPADRVLTVLDVGFGEGDMLRSIARVAAQHQRSAKLIGIDLNPRGAPAARAATPSSLDIEYRTGDAFTIPEDEPIDLIVSSLVTHHMAEDEIRAFLRWMESRARLGWLVNDLHRNLVPYVGFSALSWAMRWHPFVRHDGPLSIARAFTRAEWTERLEVCGLADVANVEWWFPFRYCVERRRW